MDSRTELEVLTKYTHNDDSCDGQANTIIIENISSLGSFKCNAAVYLYLRNRKSNEMRGSTTFSVFVINVCVDATKQIISL